jgi:hypothetical protein
MYFVDLLPRRTNLLPTLEVAWASACVVRRLVELRVGRVEAASKELGHGAEFTVGLPLLQDAVPVTPEAAAQPANDSLRVVVVEDNHDSNETLCMLLRSHRHCSAQWFEDV